ncbi:MAG: AraC family transcriptional regulator [Myxococcales bacterium]
MPFLLQYFGERGGDVRRLLSAYGLPEDAVAQPDLALTVGDLREIVSDMALALGDDFFGLHAAQWTGRGGWGIINFLLESAGTLRECIAELVRYQSLASQVVHLGVEEQRAGWILKMTVPGHPEGLGRQGNEFALALLAHQTRLFLGTPEPAERVWLGHPAPRDTAPLLEFFRTKNLVFDVGFNAIQAPLELIDRPLPRADPLLNAALKSQLAAATQGPSRPFLDLVREKTGLALQSGPPAIERVSRLLAMSDRTLQRRLREEGTSFREVVEEVRRETSETLLAQPHLGLGEVAFLLGYTDVSTFVRAFRRWTGKTPGAFRAGLG